MNENYKFDVLFIEGIRVHCILDVVSIKNLKRL